MCSLKPKIVLTLTLYDVVPSALVGDLWDPKTRGKAMILFAVTPFTGPALGPVVAGYIALTGTSWRWIFWVLTIFVSNYCLASQYI